MEKEQQAYGRFLRHYADCKRCQRNREGEPPCKIGSALYRKVMRSNR